MLADFTDITILLDASQSMLATSHLTKQSLIDFIVKQQAEPGEANLTLVEFSTVNHFRYLAKDQPIASFKVEDFTYAPYGNNTALRDAWVKLMTERGNHFASLPESSRPNKVVFVVITDGMDNASAHSQQGVKDFVSRQERTYNWEFFYIGANQDAIVEGTNYGVKLGSTLTYSPGSIGFVAEALGATVSTYRTTSNLVSFSDEDRTKSVGGK